MSVCVEGGGRRRVCVKKKEKGKEEMGWVNGCAFLFKNALLLRSFGLARPSVALRNDVTLFRRTQNHQFVMRVITMKKNCIAIPIRRILIGPASPMCTAPLCLS
jgi:hypothetical protein